MGNIDILVWRANQEDANGHMLTYDALLGMAEGLTPGSEIFFNFDFRRRIGHVIQVWIEGDDLYVTAAIDEPVHFEALRDGKTAIRPGFSIEAEHQEDGRRVIDEVGVTHVSATTSPMPLPGDQA